MTPLDHEVKPVVKVKEETMMEKVKRIIEEKKTTAVEHSPEPLKSNSELLT